MPRKKKNLDEPVKSKLEVREEIRQGIRADQSTLLKKQLALKEAMRSEDRRRLEFIDRKIKYETRALPINIIKLIGSLKRAIRQTMRYKGGTPFSIIRNLFIYWDADKSGEISAEELLSCMNSLGVIISMEECQEVVSYYNGGKPGGEMRYSELLKDIQVGEPTIIEYVSEKDELEASKNEIHFEQFVETFQEKPLIVNKFVEAMREYIQKLLRDEGGTPEQHIRFLFNFYDFDYSGGLYPEELIIACKRSIKLKVNDAQAKQIVEYYDRKRVGQMHYESFVADICSNVKPVLHFTELTPRGIAAAKESLSKNPFIPKPFKATPNRVLERFKRDCRKSLVSKINKLGGNIASWVRDAFIFFDPGYTRKISSVENMLGVAKRLGVTLTALEGKALIKCYDRFNTNELHYDFLAEDLTNEAPNILQYDEISEEKPTPTQRTPPMVQKTLKKIRNACDSLSRQSKGILQAKDFLHGTFVRFDKLKSGRIDASLFKTFVAELKLKLSDSDILATLKWFDTDGSNCLDYDALTKQIYGSDISTEKLVLPRIKEGYRIVATESFSYPEFKRTPTVYGSAIEDLPLRQELPKVHPEQSSFGKSANVLAKNLDIIESRSVQLARAKMKRHKILQERNKITRKIAVIDEQKKRIIEDFKFQRERRKQQEKFNKSMQDKE